VIVSRLRRLGTFLRSTLTVAEGDRAAGTVSGTGVSAPAVQV
jgi:hypothetical protein